MAISQRDKSVSFHEAGHAVCAYRMGMKLGKLTIVPEGKTAGSCHATGGSCTSRAVYQIAGSVAETKYRTDSGLPVVNALCSSDLDGLELAVGVLSPQVTGSRARGTLLDDPTVLAIITEAQIMV